VADYGSGLQVIAVSNPTSPNIRGSSPWIGLAHSVAVSGTLAYVGNTDGDLYVIDVTNPARPTPLANYGMGGWAEDVYLSGGLVYVADGRGGLKILRYTPDRRTSAKRWALYE
jgi:hypothetical protein